MNSDSNVVLILMSRAQHIVFTYTHYILHALECMYTPH